MCRPLRLNLQYALHITPVVKLRALPIRILTVKAELVKSWFLTEHQKKRPLGASRKLTNSGHTCFKSEILGGLHGGGRLLTSLRQCWPHYCANTATSLRQHCSYHCDNISHITVPSLLTTSRDAAFNDPVFLSCRAAFHTLLKMSKLLFTVVGYAQVTVVAEAIQPSDPSCSPPPVSASAHNAAVILQQALQFIPNPATECMLRNMAVRLAGHLSSLVRFKLRFRFRFRSELYRKDPIVPGKSGVGISRISLIIP